jgi:hypothetical protein
VLPKEVIPENSAPYDLSSEKWIGSPEPYVCFLAQVFAMVIADRGQSLSFRERENSLAMIVEDNGTTWEFEEPPRFVAFPSAQLMRAMCGIDTKESSETQQASTSFMFIKTRVEAAFSFRGNEVDVQFQYQDQLNVA